MKGFKLRGVADIGKHAIRTAGLTLTGAALVAGVWIGVSLSHSSNPTPQTIQHAVGSLETRSSTAGAVTTPTPVQTTPAAMPHTSAPPSAQVSTLTATPVPTRHVTRCDYADGDHTYVDPGAIGGGQCQLADPDGDRNTDDSACRS